MEDNIVKKLEKFLEEKPLKIEPAHVGKLSREEVRVQLAEMGIDSTMSPALRKQVTDYVARQEQDSLAEALLLNAVAGCEPSREEAIDELEAMGCKVSRQGIAKPKTKEERPTRAFGMFSYAGQSAMAFACAALLCLVILQAFDVRQSNKLLTGMADVKLSQKLLDDRQRAIFETISLLKIQGAFSPQEVSITIPSTAESLFPHSPKRSISYSDAMKIIKASEVKTYVPPDKKLSALGGGVCPMSGACISLSPNNKLEP